MAPAARAEVAFVSLKNCLVNLPPNLIALLSNANTPVQNVIIELQYRSQTLSKGAVSSGGNAGFQRSAYVGWTGMPSRTRHASVVNIDRSRPGSRDLDVQVVEIDGTFAKLLGLTEGQKVGLLVHLDPPVAHTVNIEPLTPADWEAIELHATFLELNMLSQIRALPNPSFASKTSTSLETNHPLTLHLSPTSTANITVTSIVPPQANTIPFLKISPDAEVIVAPKTRPSSSRSTKGDSRSIASRRSGKSGGSHPRSSGGRKSSSYKNAIFMRAIDHGVAIQFFESDSAGDTGLKVWLSKETIASDTLKGATHAAIALVKPAGLRAQLDQTQMQRLKEEESSDVGRPSSRVVAEILTWDKPVDSYHVGLSSLLCEMLGVKGLIGNIVRIEPAFRPLHQSSIQSLQLFPFTAESAQKKDGLKFGGESKAGRQATIDKVRLAYDGQEGLLSGPLTDGMILPASGDSKSATFFAGGILRFQQRGSTDNEPNDTFVWALGKERKHDIEARSEIPRPLDTTSLFPSFAHDLPRKAPELIGADKVIRQSLANLTLCSSILLTGSIGSGKTSVSYHLSQRLREDYLFNVTYFPCDRLVTDETRVSTIKDTLTRLFMSASWCARLGGRSVVVLDDLDKICPVEAELQVGNDNERSRQVTELLCSIVRQYCSIHSGVALLATAKSKDAVHNLIIGGHIAGDIVSIQAPTKEVRRDILQRLTSEGSRAPHDTKGRISHSRNSSDPQSISENSWMDPSNPSSRPGSSSSQTDGFHVSPSLDFLEIAGKTDGYMPADLVLLVSRARNQSLTRAVTAVDSTDASLTLTKADFEAALQNFTPTSLRNVTLTHSSTTFSSIGGLHTTRKTLLETLLYPTKYAPIFAKSPLRLRSGLLLYGYPGCGKTLLASAVAGECNLNFISVKGPEILNKYIGASEKSVRDLFERAQAAKPCVLFFDEFDSIAPKRGHDSTGVTDRVVNQMLTQMDGAEGLEGVYVLAATSRPDLIDPALLRPGRLDKSLLCDMPTMDDRLDILEAVSKKLVLSSNVANRLSIVAEKTEGFTGADLQALMYNAHLEAIHDLLGNKPGSGSKSNMANGTHQQGKGSTSSKSKTGSRRHDFSQFLYGADEDAEARQSRSTIDSKATIAAKLDELKMVRKRERAAMRGDYSSLQSRSSDQGNSAEQAQEDKTGVVIDWNHIERSLATTRSSISPQERRRLAAIYTEFVVGRKGDMPNGDGSREIGGRSSLM